MTEKIDQIKQRRADQKKKQMIIIGAVLSIGILFIIGLILYPKNAQVSNIKTAVPVTRPNPVNNSVGDPNAPVKVEELADFQCPGCAYFAQEIEPQIINVYVKTGKVHITFRPFSFLGVESSDAAAAAYCAMDQGKFWDYHDILFANQTGENVGDFKASNLKAFASQLQLDLPKFDTCVKTPEIIQKVKDDVIYGRTKSISGTPSFLVNGNLVMLEGLMAEIDKALAAK